MSSSISNKLAAVGEDLASENLVRLGYQILAQNYYTSYGELDIVAKDEDEVVFVEVKTRSCHSQKAAENSVTISKQHKLTLSALQYLAENSVYKDLSCRFDVVIVFYYDSDETYKINHVIDAFKPRLQNNLTD